MVLSREEMYLVLEAIEALLQRDEFDCSQDKDHAIAFLKRLNSELFKPQ